MAREGQGYPCYQRDMMMMMSYEKEGVFHTSQRIYIYIYKERDRQTDKQRGSFKNFRAFQGKTGIAEHFCCGTTLYKRLITTKLI